MSGRLPLRIRSANPEDAAEIAALHAASWRANYRGSFDDAYLDGPIHGERLQIWTDRLLHAQAGQITLLAEAGGIAVGFVCVVLDHDRAYGSFIDNLHVAVARKGQGLGRRLMREAGKSMLDAVPLRPAYLFVLAANLAAQAFYDRMGGSVAERLRSTEPDGGRHAVLRYVWSSPAALLEGSHRGEAAAEMSPA